jgi:hypothetical protein
MCHYIHNVIIKLLYNDSKMTINIIHTSRIMQCRELISTNIMHINNIKTLIMFLFNMFDIWCIFKIFYMNKFFTHWNKFY